MAVSVSTNTTVPRLSLIPQEKVDYKICGKSLTHLVKRLYWGDNLDVMQVLCNDTTICGHIKLIYIDPPYNTGGSFETRSFEHAYCDNYEINDYLSFMEVRLKLMYKLLSQDGSIYVHLDSNMVFHVKILMDNIFGSKNFRGMITRKKCKSKNYTHKTFGNISDYILYYTKCSNPIWNRPFDEWSDEKILKEYPYIEEGTNRRYKKVPVHAPGVRN